tara:strand:- start:2630 stop:3457 length:828 start_codon:yes stop_codon:yes gene_type:complete
MKDIFVGTDAHMQNPENFGAECYNNFMKELGDDVTGSCMIPMNLPLKQVKNIVKRAKGWFYKNYEDSVKENFFVIPKATFSTPYFKSSRIINLPTMDVITGGGEVYSIFGVNKTDGSLSSDINFAQGDFSIERMFAGGMYDGGSSVTAAENLEYYVINEKFFDLARQILDNPIGFNYSRLTHQLRITGESPTTDVVLKVYETIPECALFQDEAFFRYCAAKIKISLGQKLGIFGFALPGGIQINPDLIQGLGEGELEQVIEEIKGDEGVDWMFHS